MDFVFYDTETTGLSTAFDQVLQFAAIRVNDNLTIENEEADTIDRSCKRLPYVVPSPGALAVTNVSPRELEGRNLTSYQMVREIAAKLNEWSPAIFIGYNSMGFDETLLRQAFYKNLMPTYLTNTNGNTRADVMLMVQAATIYAPEQIVGGVDTRGKPNFKLGDVARANGIEFSEEEAHDAFNDVKATLNLAKLIKERTPEIWNTMIRNAIKNNVSEFVDGESYFCLTNVFFGRVFNEIVGAISRNRDNNNEIGVFNLAYDPTDYLELDVANLIQAFGESPKRIRTIRANAQPTIMPFANAPDDIRPQTCDEATYRERAELIRDAPRFQENVSEALAVRYEEKKEAPLDVEQEIYDGFASNADQALMAHFHQMPWEARVPMINQFEDDRYKRLAERLIYVEQPDVLPQDRRVFWNQWMSERLLTQDDVPWTTIPKAIVELEDMKRGATEGALVLLVEIETYLNGLLQNAATD